MIEFGQEICGDLGAAERREWLVTNGLGGYASGTVAGLMTRRDHGLLVAALTPPLGRALMVAKLDEIAEYAGREFPLSTNRWSAGPVDPHGYRHLEHFRLEGMTPVWTYACAGALVEKRVWMRPGENTTYVHYQLTRNFPQVFTHRPDQHGRSTGRRARRVDPARPRDRRAGRQA